MAIVRLVSVSAGSSDSASVTSAGIDTTGANVVVIAVAYSAGVTPTPTDSKGNTWTALTARESSTASIRCYFAVGPTVGSGHTFTSNPGSGFPAIAAAAYSGVLAVSPFDQQNGATSNGATALSAGSVTPSENNELLVTAFGFNSNYVSVDAGFTAFQTINVGANAWGIGLADLIQTSAGAVNPAWTQSGSLAIAAAVATFKAALTTAPHRMFAVF